MPEAEYSREAAEHRLGIFLPFYNAEHGTSFTLEHWSTPPDDSVDYYFEDGEGNDIRVQWTRTPVDTADRVAPKEADAFMDRLKYWLNHRSIVGVHVYLSVRGLPKDKDKLAYLLAYFVGQKAMRRTRDSLELLYEYERLEWNQHKRVVEPYFDWVAISRRTGEGAAEAASIAISPRGVHVTPTAGELAQRALTNKAGKLYSQAHDLVLVIEFDVDPYTNDRDLDWIRHAAGSYPHDFGEVWVLRDTVVPEARSDRVFVRSEQNETGEAGA